MLIVVGMIITFFIVYQDIDHLLAAKFVFSFLIFLLLFCIFFVLISLINIRNLNKIDKRKRFYQFMICFILYSSCSLIIYYVIEPSKIDFYQIVFLSMAFSLGFTLCDLLFFKKK